MFHLNYHVSTQTCRLRDVPQNFLCFISTAMFPRSVLTTDMFIACSHTKRRVSVHFLTYEVMPMRNFKHITPCLSHNFQQVQLKQSTTSQLFNLRTLLTMHLLTHKDVSVCKLSHEDVSVCNVSQNF